VSVVSGVAGMLLLGVGLGLQFNPVTSLAGSVVAAALVGHPNASPARRPIAVAVLVGAWLAGDGIRIGRDLITSPPKAALDWAPLVLWAVVGLLVGYVAPAAAGALVGRRVTHGTGWLSAGAVALAVAGALAVVAPMIADGVTRLGAGG
jgi:hypothetical protein